MTPDRISQKANNIVDHECAKSPLIGKHVDVLFLRVGARFVFMIADGNKRENVFECS